MYISKITCQVYIYTYILILRHICVNVYNVNFIFYRGKKEEIMHYSSSYCWLNERDLQFYSGAISTQEFVRLKSW